MKIGKLAMVALLALSTIAATEVAPSNAELEAMYDRAFRAFDAADYDQALKELDGIDARKPDLAASQNLRGVIYMRQGIFDKAEAALSESKRLDPKFWNARFNLAEIPFLKKDWPEARKRFQELLSNNAADLQGEATQLIQYKIFLTYLLEQNDAMVDSILAKFELSRDTPAMNYANAAIALQHKNLPEARNSIQAAEKNFTPQLNKLFEESLFEVGWVQQPPGQQRTALQLLTPEERENGAKGIAQADLDQAQQAYEARDFDRASKLAEQADAAQPTQPAVLNLRGEILLEQGKLPEAEEFFNKALKVDGKFREAQFNQAEVPFRQKDYAKARDRFQALLKQTPGGDKNQAAQLINFKIYMTYLLEGKDSRAQKLMEQFQFSGDTPALYYANAAWEFRHGKTDTANDWIASARKIYPLASNAAYSTGFYDLGWLKAGATASSSPAPSAAVDAAAVASAQSESPVPAIEPSPIPGAETKSEETGFVSNQAAASAGKAPAATSPSRAETSAASPSISPAAEKALANASPVAPAPSTSVVAAGKQIASPASAAARSPSAGAVYAPEFTRSEEHPRGLSTFVWITLLLIGLGILGWVVIRRGGPEVRDSFEASRVGTRPAPATGPDLDSADGSAPLAPAGPKFSGGPRQVSVELKASEPSPTSAFISPAPPEIESFKEPETPESVETVPAAEPPESPITSAFEPELAEDASSNGERTEQAEDRMEEAARETHWTEPEEAQAEEKTTGEPAPAWSTSSRYSDFDESTVGPVIEQTSVEAEPAEEPASILASKAEAENREPAMALGTLRASEDLAADAGTGSPAEDPSEPEVTQTTSAEVVDPLPEEIATEGFESTGEPADDTEVTQAAPADAGISPAPELARTEETEPIPEPIAQGQPVPYLTTEEDAEEEQTTTWAGAEIAGVSGAVAGLGALRGAMPSEPAEEEEFSSQPTTIHTMPETQTAPVIRTPAGQSSTSASAPHAAAGGVHTAVHITLSCEIASMQLTPGFKMGALQLRPISKVVTMRLAPAQQQQQNGMNLANFEIAKVQPAPGSLGQIRLAPSQQQKPATLNTPSFNISGLQVVSGFESAPLQLTPSQQGQASVHLTAAFQITTVEFSPTFDVAAMILNSSSKTVAVQLPAATGGAGDGPLFEITNVQLTANGEIGMLQLNPATNRRG